MWFFSGKEIECNEIEKKLVKLVKKGIDTFNILAKGYICQEEMEKKPLGKNTLRGWEQQWNQNQKQSMYSKL